MRTISCNYLEFRKFKKALDLLQAQTFLMVMKDCGRLHGCD